jgi:lysophospholipase L1-like esterase
MVFATGGMAQTSDAQPAQAPAIAQPAQEPGSLPETKAPAAAEAPAAAQTETEAEPAPAPVSNWLKEHEAQMEEDWPYLGLYKKANKKLGLPAPGENRVVFMGDSITQDWKIEGKKGSFPGKPYINRGIKAQTTRQMVLRFRQDVIDLKPKAVVILAGINDIAGNTGPETLEEIEGNFASMADLATANQIRVVLCSVLPAAKISWVEGLKPAPQVVALNTWMKAYAAQKGYVYVDFHTAMKDEHDGLQVPLTLDGIHPSPAGYAIMAPLAEAGIEKALSQ